MYDALVRNGTICSLEQRRKLELHDAVVKDAGSLISEVKEGRANDSRAAVQMAIYLLCRNMVNEKRLQSLELLELIGIVFQGALVTKYK